MAEMNGKEVLFLRNRDCNDEVEMEEMWDDTALIRAYDKAISAVHKKLNIPESGSKGKKKKTRKPGNTWKVGDSCMAEFSEDGYFYEALVTSIDHSRGKCVVKYKDYGNEEERDTSHILDLDASLPDREFSDELDHSTVSSVGRLSVNDSKSDKSRSKKNKKRPGGQVFGNPPTSAFSRSEYLMRAPQYSNAFPRQYGGPGDNFGSNFNSPGSRNQFKMPPLPPNLRTNSDDPALNSMLMSWYMCGYHSGYYHGVNDANSGNLQ